METEKLYTVKELCEKYGITRKTLFYYDKTDLVKPTKRIGTQLWKLYSDDDVRQLEIVLMLREAGLSIDEIKTLTLRHMTVDENIIFFENVKARLLMEKENMKRELNKLEVLINDLKEMNDIDKNNND